MSVELIKFAFIAGELSPAYQSRADLEKFDLGLARALNFFVDYRGGASNRPGTEFIDYIKSDDKPVRMEEFRFNSDLANVYVMMFGENYVRFLQDGAYVLEAAKPLTSMDNIGLVTLPTHGYVNGDWIKISGSQRAQGLEGRAMVVGDATANTFKLYTTYGNALVGPIEASGSYGFAARIYTVATPYAGTDLEQLHVEQRRDLVRLTHPNFATRDLQRLDHANWTLTATVIGTEAARPTGVTTVPSDTTNTPKAGIAYAVTTVTNDGQESISSDIRLETNSVDISAEGANITVRWNAQADAQYYKVYRSNIIFDGAGRINRGAQLGYLGKSFGAVFVDNNIIPDFVAAPPIGTNPFANQAIESISITNGGSGYTQSSTISVGGPGSGFRGFPVVEDGKIVGVVVSNGGSGYSAPVVTTGGSGSGATFTVKTSPAAGNYPSLSATFQQRQIYAASLNQPLTVWGSKPKQYGNFDASSIVSDGDSYEFEIDSNDVTPIRHMMATRSGLLLLTDTGIWVLNGGNNGAAITPTNVLADPHTYTGCSKVAPVRVETDIYYVESKGNTVRQLEYNDYSRLYSGKDVSILSNHLFAKNRKITRMAAALDPYKIIWAVRSDGALLAFTVVKEQEVYAWTECRTRGQFKDVLCVQENETDRVYLVVKRFRAGVWVQYLERLALRDFADSEEAFFLDCGVMIRPTFPAAELSISAASGTVTITASAAVFTVADVGKVLRTGGGKGTVTAFVDANTLTVQLNNPISNIMFEDPLERPMPQVAGTWTLDAPFTVLRGLHYLAGETVTVLLDGSVVKNQVVDNAGRVFLPEGMSGTRAIVGLPYRSLLRTLPITVPNNTVESRRKRVVSMGMRLLESRGLKTGVNLSKLYEAKERRDENYGEATRLQTRFAIVPIEPVWDDDGQTFIVQDNPLPASILGLVQSIEVGDDPD